MTGGGKARNVVTVANWSIARNSNAFGSLNVLNTLVDRSNSLFEPDFEKLFHLKHISSVHFFGSHGPGC